MYPCKVNPFRSTRQSGPPDSPDVLILDRGEKSRHAPGAIAGWWKSIGSERAPPPLISVPFNVMESVIAAFVGSVGESPVIFYSIVPYRLV